MPGISRRNCLPAQSHLTTLEVLSTVEVGGGASTEIVTCRRKVAAERSMFEVFVTLGRHVPGGNSSSRGPDLQDLLLG